VLCLLPFPVDEDGILSREIDAVETAVLFAPHFWLTISRAPFYVPLNHGPCSVPAL